MNPESRFDAQVRAGLLEEPLPNEVATRQALAAVLQRSARPARRRVGVISALAAAAAVAAALAVPPVVLDDEPSAPPISEPDAPARQVVGDWERQVPDGEWAGTWRMDLMEDGVAQLVAPAEAAAVDIDGVSYSVAGNQFRIDAFVNGACPEQPAGVYRWTVSGATLRLSALSEPCEKRAEVFEGTWARFGE